MNSGNVVLPDSSGSVNPADIDAGRELLDHLLVDRNLQMTDQNVEMMKRLMQTRFTDESLIFLLHKIQEIQLDPTLQQYWKFIHDYEGIKYLKKSIAEITGENMNLRIEKESDKRCLKALFKIIEQLTTEKTQLGNQNRQLATQNGHLITENGQLITEKDQVTTLNGQLDTQYGQLATQYGQLATEKDQLATQNGQLDTQYGQLATEMDQLATQYGQLATEKDQLATQYGQFATEKDQLAT
ncbi:uncharacterized protein LOC143047358 [Mytilus galloprovincialis]|uniref:uncharacterized protein LOC143047358 n=1 Tax=Mytilus galloprovincialis TaxID=29158 RepID=UPI003F7BF4DB